MLLKSDYPLRSRNNKAGKSGTVGLCVYLDLEQQKRRERREQAEAARRQQAIDQAIAEVGGKSCLLACVRGVLLSWNQCDNELG